MNHLRCMLLMVLIAGVACGGGWAYLRWTTWKRFAVVEPGVLYRSGMMRPEHFRQALRAYGIRTVFSLTFTDNERVESVCHEAGVQRHFHYLAGNGVGPDDPYLRFLEIVQDPANHPVLVHCSAGVQRTGGAVALFRMQLQGWSFDNAIAEMIRLGNDGNAPQREQLRRLHERLPVSPGARDEGRGIRLGYRSGSKRFKAWVSSRP